MVLNKLRRGRPDRVRSLDPPTIPWANSDHGKPRVLLECPPEKSPSIIAEILEREGFGVVVCEGPTENARCPLTEGGYCGTVQGVDVVVNLLGEHRAGQPDVLTALADSGPRPPIVVGELASGVEPRADIRWISPNVRRSELISVVRDALTDELRSRGRRSRP